MAKSKFQICLWLMLLMFLPAAFSQQGDDFLRILQEEMRKNKAQLDQKEAGVYLLSYRVDEQTAYTVKSSMGSLLSNRHETNRILTVQVRVGDYDLDNFHELRDDYSDIGTGFSYVQLPLTDESQAIAQMIWRETDRAYREAKQRYERVKANVAVKVVSDDQAPDYSHAAREVYFEPPVPNIVFDDKAWIERLKALSAVFKTNTDAIYAGSTISYIVERKYFVNSENTSIVQNNTACHLYVNVSGKADDGMDLPLLQSYYAHTPDQLPPQSEMLLDAQELNDKISRLVNAPVADAFTGPAILSKNAAGVFFHEIFGHRMEGQRLKQSDDGQTFKKKIGETILPKDISVVFDPSLLEYNGLPLNGHYQFDEEGFRGYRVPVVEQGVLKSFLMTRTPIDDFPLSNGHARAEAGYQPVSRQSNLIVESSTPYTDEQLRQMLIAEAKAQGKEYGYFFASVQGGFTTTGRYLPNAFNVIPLEVYKVYVDGRPDELVRGVDLVGTPLSMFSKIEAVGKEHGNFSGYCGAESGYVPVSCCSPALFVKQIETQKKNKSQQKPPIIPKKYSSYKGDDMSFETICFDAMEDEIEQNMTALHIDGMQSPYFISYLISDAQITQIKTSLGAVISSFQVPYRDKDVTVLVGNDKLNNQHYFDVNELIQAYNTDGCVLPVDNDFYTIRQNLWLATDLLYKTHAEKLEAKKAAMQQQNLPQKQLDLRDRSAVVSHNVLLEKNSNPIDLVNYEVKLSELSKLFEHYPDFVSSGVDLTSFLADAYYMDSEGLKYKQPFNILCISVFAQTHAIDGEPIADAFNLYYTDVSQIPSEEELKRRIMSFADRLLSLRTAKVMEENYDGPVLFADEAAAVLFEQCFFKNEDGLLASRKPIFSSAELAQLYGNYAPKDNPTASLMNKKVVSRDLTIESRNTLTQYDNTPLIGSYQYDAEGVAAEDQQLLIEKGVLLQLLSDRQPAEKADYSNGHRRLVLNRYKLGTCLGPGVVQMTGKTKSSYKQLKRKLMAMAKAEDYEYCYVVTKLLDDALKYYPGMGKYKEANGILHPLCCYRINVKTGEEELVRMVKIPTPSLKLFKHIVSVSSEQQVYNTMMSAGKSKFSPASDFMLWGYPASFILPKAMLFEEMEVSRDFDVTLEKEAFRPNPLKD